MRGGQRRGAATSRRVQETGTRSEASLAPRRIQALVGRRVPRPHAARPVLACPEMGPCAGGRDRLAPGPERSENELDRI
jgi:hypothetical protein